MFSNICLFGAPEIFFQSMAFRFWHHFSSHYQKERFTKCGKKHLFPDLISFVSVNNQSLNAKKVIYIVFIHSTIINEECGLRN